MLGYVGKREGLSKLFAIINNTYGDAVTIAKGQKKCCRCNYKFRFGKPYKKAIDMSLDKNPQKIDPELSNLSDRIVKGVQLAVSRMIE